MNIFNRWRAAIHSRGISPLMFLGFLICISGIALLMVASFAGTGLLVAFNNIVGGYHSHEIRSSDTFLASDLEYLVKKFALRIRKKWKNSPLVQQDFSQSRCNLAAWYCNFENNELSLVSASGAIKVPLPHAGLPFLAATETDVSNEVRGEEISLPVLPPDVRWQITSQTSGKGDAWVMWGSAKSDSTAAWGFRLRIADLRSQLVKVLRRLCHDNHMKVALLNPDGKLFIAANSNGELKNLSSLTPGRNQELITRKVGVIWPGMTLQVVYTPGIFGQLPDWAADALMIAISIIGIIITAGIYGFYAIERRSANKLRLQNDWVLNLAHSLRGPCHSLGVLLEAVKSNRSGDNEELFRLGHREIEAMDSHCRQFLQLARADVSGFKGAAEPVELSGCITRVLERITIRFPQFSTELVKIDGVNDLTVSAYPLALEEALVTIIDNAVKYSGATRPVVIKVKTIDCRAQVIIEDSGAGIAPQDMDQIGSPFYRSSRTDLEGVTGTGIGLYLVKESCRANDWQFAIESEGKDRGTRVILSIPVVQK